ncbi:MAG: glycosyltransferase [Symbiopectobacterium sp.]
MFTDYLDEDNISEFTELSHQYDKQIIVYLISCNELKKLLITKNWYYVTYFRFIISNFSMGYHLKYFILMLILFVMENLMS